MSFSSHSSNSKRSPEKRRITFDTDNSETTEIYSNTEPKSVEVIDLAELRENCYKLKKYALFQKTDPRLPKKDYDLIMKVSDDLVNTYSGDLDGTYEKAHAILVEVFGGKKNAEPGSVAKYFVGCLEEVGSDSPAGCSPECAGNVPLPKGPANISVCDSHIGYYQKGQLEITYNPRKKSNIILIHQNQEKCVLNLTEIAELKSYGIEKAVISTKQDGAWKTISPTAIAIENLLPLTKKPVTKSPVVQEKSSKKTTKNSNLDTTAVWCWVFIAFMFLIIIFVVVFYFYRSGTSEFNPATQVTTKYKKCLTSHTTQI